MTLIFPQLSTGAMVQFPIRKSLVRRTVLNRLSDGSTIRLADPDASYIIWDLRYRGLNDKERADLEHFFEKTEGPLKTFLFLDPCSNLLVWSEQLEKEVWTVDSLLRAERDGGVLRLTNTAQDVQTVTQTVPVPAAYTYCFSAFLRSSDRQSVELFLEGGSDRFSSVMGMQNSWSHAFCSASMTGDSDEIRCGLSIPAGAVVEVVGLQLQAQPSAAEYRRTTSEAGVFPQTRFHSDALEFQAEGIDDHSTMVRLISPAGVR